MTDGHIALLAETLSGGGGAERALMATAAAGRSLGQAWRLYAPAWTVPAQAPSWVVPVPLRRRAKPWRVWDVAHALAPAARQAGAHTVIAGGKLLHADLYWPHGGLHVAALEANELDIVPDVEVPADTALEVAIERAQTGP